MNSKSNYSQERAASVTFFFEGKRLRGYKNEPIAKALFRAGVRTLSYSIRYHRPRGIHCMRGRCGMCHMEVNGMPGVPTCTTPLEEGMRIRRENFGPFYGPLISAAAGIIPLPAGFYYRMFTGPAFIRKLFMKNLRSMAGVGRIPTSIPNAPAQRIHSTLNELPDGYDVIVVGGGLSGMSAAFSAGKTGARVLLVDEYSFLGGHSIGALHDQQIEQERDQLKEQISAAQSIKIALATTAYGFYSPDKLLLGSGGSVKLLTSKAFIFATGSYDLVPLFKNNDLPGIFGERSMRLLLERDQLKPGKRAIIYGSGEPLLRCISLLSQHGIEIALAGENKSGNGGHAQTGISITGGLKLIKAHGRSWVRGASFAQSTIAGGKTKFKIAGDMICTAFKGQPAYELAYQADFTFAMEESNTNDNERNMLPIELEKTNSEGTSLYIVGEASGEAEWQRKITQGKEAGEKAAMTFTSFEKEPRNG